MGHRAFKLFILFFVLTALAVAVTFRFSSGHCIFCSVKLVNATERQPVESHHRGITAYVQTTSQYTEARPWFNLFLIELDIRYYHKIKTDLCLSDGELQNRCIRELSNLVFNPSAAPKDLYNIRVVFSPVWSNSDQLYLLISRPQTLNVDEEIYSKTLYRVDEKSGLITEITKEVSGDGSQVILGKSLYQLTSSDLPEFQ